MLDFTVKEPTASAPPLAAFNLTTPPPTGLCIRTAHSLDCRPTAGSDIGALADSFHPPPNGTISPQLRRLLETALRLQSRVLVSPLPGAGVSFALSLICWYLTRRVEPGVNQKRGLPRWVNCAFWTCCGASLALSLGSALCATVVVGAAVFVSDLAPASSPVLIAADTRHVIALQWVLVCLVLFFMLLAKDKCGKCEAKAAGEEGPILPTKEPESSSSSEEGVAGALQVNPQQQPSPSPITTQRHLGCCCCGPVAGPVILQSSARVSDSPYSGKTGSRIGKVRSEVPSARNHARQRWGFSKLQ